MYQKNDQDILRNVRPTATGPTVRLPDNRQIKCTAIGNLPITTMSSRAKQSYIMPDLHSSSLLSIGQLCDENYSAVFTKKHGKIFDQHNNIALTGQRNNQDGLWDVNFQSPIQQSQPQLHSPSPTANVILRRNMSDSNLAAFLKSRRNLQIISAR